MDGLHSLSEDSEIFVGKLQYPSTACKLCTQSLELTQCDVCCLLHVFACTAMHWTQQGHLCFLDLSVGANSPGQGGACCSATALPTKCVAAT